MIFLQGGAVLTSHLLCIYVKTWVKDLWWEPWLLLTLQPSCWSPWPLSALWIHHWEARNIKQDPGQRPSHDMWLHNQHGKSPELLPQEWVRMYTWQSLLRFLFWPKALSVRVQVFCGQGARNSQHILRKAKPFSGSAGSFITYQCPMEHLQRHILLSDL